MDHPNPDSSTSPPDSFSPSPPVRGSDPTPSLPSVPPPAPEPQPQMTIVETSDSTSPNHFIGISVLLFLVITTAIGVYLVQQNQDLFRRASEPPSEIVTSACREIKIYDTNWQTLSATQLSQLTANTPIHIAVRGDTTQGQLTKAKFIINGQELETDQKRPGTEEFYLLYQLPEGLTQFNIQAQMFHPDFNQWF